MAEYGYYKKGKRKKKRTGWRFVLWILDVIILVATIVCSLFLLLSYLSKYINPESFSFIALTGLILPILYMSEIMLGLYWIIRWKRHAIAVTIILVAGIGSAKLFYRPDFKAKYEEEHPKRSDMVVMSYNVMNFHEQFSGGEHPVEELIGKFVSDNYVDILCFQEFNGGGGNHDRLDEHLKDMRYRSYVNYDMGTSPTGTGIAIYSRYPIVKKGVVTSESDERAHSMWADIAVKRDTVRVINNHLQSTYVNNDEVDFLSSFRFMSEESGGKAKVKEIVNKLKENYKKRAPQAVAVRKFIDDSPYPVIVCGDFNDTPQSYAYHKISRKLNDAFVKKGSGVTGTYNGFFNMFRIDYILMSDEIEIVNYYPYDVAYSDHNPVAASFEFSRLK